MVRVPPRLGAVAIGFLALAIAGTTVAAPPATAEGERVVMWVEPAVAPLVEQEFTDGFRGATVVVVAKDLKAIKDELKTATGPDAPDIIWADHAWTGELAAAGLVTSIPMSSRLRRAFPVNVLEGFNYGFGTYGIPVQYENVALISNAQMVPSNPKDFDALAKAAKKLVENGDADVGIAVGQGANGNAYFMNPFFAGLGGYVFGTNAAGSLDAFNIGIANPTFLANTETIDRWNSQGLLNSNLDLNAAQSAFTSGRAPFWITGQWSRATLTGLTFRYRISPLPTMVKGQVPAPFLGIKGFMVTSYAQQHQVSGLAVGLLRKRLSDPGFQSKVAALSGRAPANLKSTIDTSALLGRIAQAFAVSGRQGVPLPNIPQATATWGPMGKAWASATRGPGSVPAFTAFTEAQAAVQQALG
jgi:arabinogalactan oligomer/maltooligosaccharide transport system substrate-binding protein